MYQVESPQPLRTWRIYHKATPMKTRALRECRSPTRQHITPQTARIHNLESQHGGDPDQPQNLVTVPLIYHCKAILKISSKSANNSLSDGSISDWAVSMVIRFTTTIKSLVPFISSDPSIKFNCNPFTTFGVMLLTDRQKDKQNDSQTRKQTSKQTLLKTQSPCQREQ